MTPEAVFLCFAFSFLCLALICGEVVLNRILGLGGDE